MDSTFRSFVHQVMPVALQEGVAVQTMKPMGGGFLLQAKAMTPAECLQYAPTQHGSVVIHGMNTMEHLEEALGVVKSFQPITPA
jgi:predicted aldo/keto reductase-like oxidoreductase